MKKSLIILAALAPLAVSSCLEESMEAPQHTAPTLEFTATSVATKTSLEEGVHIYWTPGDQVSVSGAAEAFVTNIKTKAPKAAFEGAAVPIDGNFYAAYPFAAVQEWTHPECPQMTLPAIQQAVKGSFANGLNLTVATGTLDNLNFQFKNLLSYLSFTVAETDVMKVKLTSKDAPLAGTFLANAQTAGIEEIVTPVQEILLKGQPWALEPGQYYIAILPGTYPTGLDFEFTDSDGRTATISFDTEKTFAAGHCYDLGTAGNLNWVAPTIVPFEEIRALASASAVTFDSPTLIKGVIISNPEAKNQGENIRTDGTHIDYTGTDRTAYIESPDGNYGFMLTTKDKKKKITLPQTASVLMDLEGMTLTRLEQPERYVISGYKDENIISIKQGQIPAKEKFINELTDQDVFTFVTLKDCEYPIRKGSLTPLDDAYTITNAVNRENQYPSLLRDINGNSIYMFTNTTCPYRRTGKMLNYYRGTVSGIIVHEKNESMEFGTTAPTLDFGTLGKYQIRHQKESDIALSADYEGNFSVILTEFRYIKEVKPSNKLTQTFGEPAEIYLSSGDVLGQYDDFSYLGPCGKNTPDKNGCGIILEDGTDYLKGAAKLNTFNGGDNGRGRANSALGLSWKGTKWWDNDKMNAWIIKFSTAGISTDQLSLQVAQLSDFYNSPIYWRAEWNDQTDNADDAGWKTIGTYYVPSFLTWSKTQLWQTSGFKMINIPLPLEMLGKETVYIRLIPNSLTSNIEGVFEGGKLMNNKHSAMSYLGIRYNK